MTEVETTIDQIRLYPHPFDSSGLRNSRPNSSEIQLIKLWIVEGAESGIDRLSRIDDESIFRLITNDVNSTLISSSGSLPFILYFTSNHLRNSGSSSKELRSLANSFSQLINSLSWNKIKIPQLIGTNNILFKIDIRDYGWSREKWESLASAFPYSYNVKDRILDNIKDYLKNPQGILRIDWFGHYASKPPFYHKLLDLPNTDKKLEGILGISVKENIRLAESSGRSLRRSGFNSSGVSFNNRLIERHKSPYGSYWKSYDFRADGQGKNLFESPLGPFGPDSFRHDGGEIIFSLPNGLQSYLLVNGTGKRIDLAPSDVVFDPASPEGIATGISCMGCHIDGIKDKFDQIKKSILASTAGTFSDEVRRKVKNIYSSQREFTRSTESDSAQFLQAIANSSIFPNSQVELTRLSIDYSKELDASRVASELGLKEETLLARIPQLTERTRRILSSLPNSTIKRTVFEENISRILSELFTQIRTANFEIPFFFWKSGSISDYQEGKLRKSLEYQCEKQRRQLDSSSRNIQFLSFTCAPPSIFLKSHHDNLIVLSTLGKLIFSAKIGTKINENRKIIGSYQARHETASTFQKITALSNWNRQCVQFLETARTNIENQGSTINTELARCGETPIDLGDSRVGQIQYTSQGLQVITLD